VLDAALCVGAPVLLLLNPSTRVSLQGILAGIFVCVVLLLVLGSHRSRLAFEVEMLALAGASAIGFAASVMVSSLVSPEHATTRSLLVAWFVTLFLLTLARVAQRRGRSDLAAQLPVPVVVVGSAKRVMALHDVLGRDIATSGDGGRSLRIAAIFADGIQTWKGAARDTVVNDARWAQSFSECCGIERGIVAIPAECDGETNELVKKSARIFRHLYIAPELSAGAQTAKITLKDGWRLQIQVGDCAAASESHFTKRAIDIAGVLCLALVSLPFLLFVAIAIPLTSKGPILFKQLRIGKGNRLFFALKFRTMFLDSSERLDHYLDGDPVLRAEWESVHKLKDDPRVTSIGRFLRRFSLDELPQLWNVLAGDMSLVGPRPIVVSEIERYGLQYAAYEAVRPGLTGLWQVSGRNDTTYQERVDYDSYYVRNWSLRLDAQIVIRTFRAVISGTGAY